MRGCHKNGLSADPVHVDACARLKVIKMDVAVFGDEKNNVVLGAYLDRDETGTIFLKTKSKPLPLKQKEKKMCTYWKKGYIDNILLIIL